MEYDCLVYVGLLLVVLVGGICRCSVVVLCCFVGFLAVFVLLFVYRWVLMCMMIVLLVRGYFISFKVT